MNTIIIKGLSQNNLKDVDLVIPKQKIIVFTGVSGSGKSSIVFDTIAAESQRQLNETYPAFIRGKLPQYRKPDVQKIMNLSPSVIVDQSPLGGNARSTVGTSSGLYTDLRLLFSRIGKPYIGSASFFSFNDPKGMCPACSGIGQLTTLNLDALFDFSKSLNEGCVVDSTYAPNTWYWKQYAESQLFDLDKPLHQYSTEEMNLFLYGNRMGKGKPENPKVGGLYNKFMQTYLHRDMSSMSKTMKEKAAFFTKREPCVECNGNRLNREVLSCKIADASIADLCALELSDLLQFITKINESSVETLLESLTEKIARMIAIGLPYLHLHRETHSLSGGEAQRLKLIRYMGSSLSDMLYIFDEPSTGMHPYDIKKVNQLLIDLRNQGNSVIVVEHDKEVIQIADEIIDVGPVGGKNGGTIVYQGNYRDLKMADTITANALSKTVPVKEDVRKGTGFLSIENTRIHNLKDISIEIPLGVMTVVTGVAGSGKSTLISRVLADKYKDDVLVVNQKPIFTSTRSTPATFLDIFDEIRSLFAKENTADKSWLSFNSKGGCEKCGGKGVIVTELVHMSPVVSTCEACEGGRYNPYALSLLYKGKTILETLSMNVDEAYDFFENTKLQKKLVTLKEVGLAYMTLGQPLSTLSGGEIQRIKLAKSLNQKAKIYILDEPSTGLHASDVTKLMDLFDTLISKGNTVIIIEHNVDIMKQADYLIDVGPEAGRNGGQIVFSGTPMEMIQNSDTLTARSLRESL